MTMHAPEAPDIDISFGLLSEVAAHAECVQATADEMLRNRVICDIDMQDLRNHFENLTKLMAMLGA